MSERTAGTGTSSSGSTAATGGADAGVALGAAADLCREEEAQALARRHTAPASDPAEAADYALALSQLGLPEASADYLFRELPNFGFEHHLWNIQAHNLMNLKRWDELRNLAVQIRHSDRILGQLEGFAGFLEGFADVGSDRSESAGPIFAKAATESFGSPELAYECALAMRSSGHPVPALRLLQSLTARATDDTDFWFQLTLTAHAAKDAGAVLFAAEKAYSLAPTNPAFQHNYAAALLANRAKPAEAVKLTLQDWQRKPDDSDAIINHALALLLNKNTREVSQLLNRIPTFGLTADTNASLQLAWFQYYVATGQNSLARVAYNRLETRRLYPDEVRWVEETFAKLPPG